MAERALRTQVEFHLIGIHQLRGLTLRVNNHQDKDGAEDARLSSHHGLITAKSARGTLKWSNSGQ